MADERISNVAAGKWLGASSKYFAFWVTGLRAVPWHNSVSYRIRRTTNSIPLVGKMVKLLECTACLYPQVTR